MATMHDRALGDLISTGYPWTYNSKTLRRGGGKAYEIATPSGNQWFKIHTRCHEQRHRYWFGINHAALEQVGAVVFWMKDERRLYVVPVSFLLDLMAEYKPRGLVTIREGQWHMDIHAVWDELELPNVSRRYRLRNYAVDIPQAVR